jgi:hypothetical protein
MERRPIGLFVKGPGADQTRLEATGPVHLELPSRDGPAYNEGVVVISNGETWIMDSHGEEPDRNAATAADSQEQAQAPSPRYKPCNDATGRVLPITPEEQARNARAIAAFVERMLAMPDEDPPGAWEEAMRDLDAHRPHRKLFEGMY